MTQGAVGAVADRIEVLRAFDRATAREAHNLARWPELTWQQLYNRAQWEGEPVRAVLTEERTRRGSPGALPWLQMRFPFAESSSLTRTLAGHSASVFACAVSPDASYIASAGADWTVMVWDAQTGTERATLLGHTQVDTSGAVVAPYPIGINALSISPDGSFIVSGGHDELKVWDATTGAERATLPHQTQVRDCVVSPEGSFIVSVSQEGTLKVWDATTYEERAELEGHTGAVNGCAIGPDGSFIVSASDDGTLRVWDPRTGQERATLTGHGVSHESGCAISPDGSFIVSPGVDNTLKIWDVSTGEERLTMHGHAMWVKSCAISPDGSFVVSASQDGTLKIWDSSAGGERATLTGQGGPVNGCAIGPDGSFIVSAGADGTVRIWDAQIRDEPDRRRWHTQTVRACAVGPDGSFIVSGGDDGTVRTWDAITGRDQAVMEGHGAPVNGCAVAPDGSFIVSASGDFMRQMMRVGQTVISRTPPNALRIWPYRRGVPWRLSDLLDMTPEELERTYFEEGSEAVERLVMDIDLERVGRDRFVASDLNDVYRRVFDRVRRRKRLTELQAPEIILNAEQRILQKVLHALIIKAASGEERALLQGHSSQVNACAIAPDGSFIVSASDDRTLKVWDAASGEEIQSLRGHSGPVAHCALSPDGSFIVSAGGAIVLGGLVDSFDATLRVWDVATFEERAKLDLDSPPMACAVSPDGSFVVSGSYTGGLTIWDAATLEERARLTGHTSPITGCAVSPDGAFVFSANRAGMLRVWDVPTGLSVAGLPLSGDLYCVALNPRSPAAVCGDEGGNVYVADLIGIEYGAIIVTPIDRDGHQILRCPNCWTAHPLDDSWLGRVIDCPTATCDVRLRINPFMAGSSRTGVLKRLFGRGRQ